MSSRSTHTLDDMPVGASGTVLALRGGREFQQRISSMGLNAGCHVAVLQRHAGEGEAAPVVVRAGDTRLMVGHGMAEKVVIRMDA